MSYVTPVTTNDAAATAAVSTSIDPVLDAFNQALKTFRDLLVKCQGENPPNPMDIQALATAIKKLNADAAKLDPKNPDEDAAISSFTAATGPDSGTGGLYALLTTDSTSISSLIDDIENCQQGNPQQFDFEQLVDNLNSLIPGSK